MCKLKQHLSGNEWLVEEIEFQSSKLNAFETKFTVGNGYLGTRGSIEEGHSSGLRGTYVNGVFDQHQSFVVDLVNAPDWTVLKVRLEGELLGLETMQVLSHYRALDLRKGVLYRETRYKDSKGRITNYESMRYASLDNVHLMQILVNITPENYSGTISIESAIDAQTFNLDVEPVFKSGKHFDSDIKWNKWARSIHTDHVESSENDAGIYLEVKTKDRNHTIGYSSVLNHCGEHLSSTKKLDFKSASEELTIQARQGKTIEIKKTVGVYTSRDVSTAQVKQECLKILESSSDQLHEEFDRHQVAWRDKWEDCEISISGDPVADHAMKFNIYHLLIAANPQDPFVNIGAKSLSGEGYRGHVFWDTEIFMLPFYALTQPLTSRSLMQYRYHTMEGAREYAQMGGFNGIRFPWESADTGHEVTPSWTSDGEVRIWTAEREQHITSAVAFGVIYHHNVTGDDQFMIDYGAETLFETARFWSSRLEFNQQQNRFELTKVEGPDEFHELVDNSVYTNALTKWNLLEAVRIFEWLSENFSKEHEELSNLLELTEEEVMDWKGLASKIYIPFDKKKKLVEQFEGYFNLQDVPITVWTKNGMPEYPEGYDHDSCQGTMLIKQPDVLMLMYILPDMFSDKVKKLNYEFYEPKTMHKSSLSPSIHSIMGIETGNFEKAHQYFRRSSLVDLIDNQGNTCDGIHIASCGGSWQAVVSGFGGLRVRNRKLTFKPWLPREWFSLIFKIQWKGAGIRVTLLRHELQLEWYKSSPTCLLQELEVNVAGRDIKLLRNRNKIVEL